ncbi:MAG TPA: nucleotide exchange factor GrpE [Clostridia bacterium]|nr:nucleotide exchange factor GrpE [Clostridia bacterium]
MAKKNRDEAAAPETLNETKISEETQDTQEESDQNNVKNFKSVKGNSKKLIGENEQLKGELNDKNEKLLRLAAEYDNFRKRTAREKEEIYSCSKVSIINEILPVIDNFERAAENSEKGFEEYKKGIEMIFEQLMEILKKMGVDSFGQVGDTFDPNMHSAVMHTEDKSFKESTVCEVFAKGYKLGEKIIRFAVVKVAN